MARYKSPRARELAAAADRVETAATAWAAVVVVGAVGWAVLVEDPVSWALVAGALLGGVAVGWFSMAVAMVLSAAARGYAEQLELTTAPQTRPSRSPLRD